MFLPFRIFPTLAHLTSCVKMDCDKETQCSNCGGAVSLQNFAVHEAFCIRNLVKCPTCDSVVPKLKLEEHSAQEHALTKCDICKMYVPKFKMVDHKTSCPARLVQCAYCELEVPANSHGDHVDRCSSRTELCSECGRFVMLRDLQKHNCMLTTGLNHQLPKLEPVGDTHLSTDLQLAEHLQYMELNSTLQPVISNLSEAKPPPREHELLRETYRSPVSETHELHFVPCEFCSDLYTTEEVMEHQFSCPANPAGFQLNEPVTSPEPINADDRSVPLASQEPRVVVLPPRHRTPNASENKPPEAPSTVHPIPGSSSTAVAKPKRTNPSTKVTHSRSVAQGSNATSIVPGRPKYELPPLRDPLIRQRQPMVNNPGAPKTNRSNNTITPSPKSLYLRPVVPSQRRPTSTSTVTVRPPNNRRSTTTVIHHVNSPTPRFPGVGRRLGGP